MVTHDVGLKFFADRIIWLRDGKIQRVETVGDVKQKEAYEGLHQDLIVRTFLFIVFFAVHDEIRPGFGH